MSVAQSLRQTVAPWQWAANTASRRVRALRSGFSLLFLLAPPLAAWHWMPPAVATTIVMLWWGICLLAWWATQFAALLRLDHPHLARLVPGHARALRASAIAQWAAATTLGAGLAVALLSGAPLPAAWPVPGPLLPLAVLGAGAALLVTAVAVRWPWLWLGVFLLVLLPFSPLLSLAAWSRPLWQAAPWWCVALLLLAMAGALAALFGRGDAVHARVWLRRERWRAITQAGMAGQKPTLAAYGRWGEWLGRPWQGLADAWLVRSLHRAQDQPANVMARAEIVLHGSQHWVRQLGVQVPVLVGLGLLCMALALVVGFAAQGQMLERGHTGIAIGLSSMVLGTVTSLPGMLWSGRREQALLLLLPGVPRGTALNQALARCQARHFLILWALSLPGFVFMAWAGPVPQVLVMPAVLWLALPWLWRRSARPSAPSAMAGVLPFLSCLALGVGLMVLLRGQPDALWPVLMAVMAAAGGLLLWQWQRLSRAPQALPAGRWG